MQGSILTLNAGSSSLKFALFASMEVSHAAARGEIGELDAAPHFIARDAAGRLVHERRWGHGETDAFGDCLAELLAFADAHLGGQNLAAIGHRVVHGGSDYINPALVTPDLLAALKRLIPLDPLHLPLNIAPIEAIAASHPGLPQVVCFDTAFHHHMPPVATRFALPRHFEAEGVRRYGFHGLSYEYIADQLKDQAPALASGRIIAAHLGSGASLCAMRDGLSIDTTTGFSPLDGLMMASRCGSLDPGVMLYLMRQGCGYAAIEDLLYHRSGLLGVSGISGDTRTLLASQEPSAKQALELFVYFIVRAIGAMASSLQGLDGLIFTAGIGEHQPEIRAAVCARLGWLGVTLDPAANLVNAAIISAPGSAIDVRVMPTNEEAMIARHTRATILAASVAA
jgi:acetate kinase